MGVLNVTPDSFSDGGLFVDPVAAMPTTPTSVSTARAGRTTLVALPRMVSPIYATPGSFMGSEPAELLDSQ